MGKPMTGEALRRAVAKLGMTQEEFAEYVGVSSRTVRRQWSGDTPVPRATALLVQNLLAATNGNPLIARR
jgi:transcriptional regulator with XRE-family HTH domain